jgi:hypothetical protein
MTREEYEEAKRTLVDVQAALARPDLSDSDRQAMQIHAFKLAGLLMSPWIPFGAYRRFIMALLVLAGLVGFVNGQPWALVLWIVAAMFSPRIVGEVSYLRGRLSRQ